MRKRLILIVIIILVLVFIWGNSVMPASISGGMSGRLTALIRRLPFMSGITDSIVRKLAHASEFALLGALLACLFGKSIIRKLPLLSITGVLAALVDETIQLFSTGRGSSVSDVWIDFAGCLSGIFIVYLIIIIKNKIKGNPKWKKR